MERQKKRRSDEEIIKDQLADILKRQNALARRKNPEIVSVDAAIEVVDAQVEVASGSDVDALRSTSLYLHALRAEMCEEALR